MRQPLRRRCRHSAAGAGEFALKRCQVVRVGVLVAVQLTDLTLERGWDIRSGRAGQLQRPPPGLWVGDIDGDGDTDPVDRSIPCRPVDASANATSREIAGGAYSMIAFTVTVTVGTDSSPASPSGGSSHENVKVMQSPAS